MNSSIFNVCFGTATLSGVTKARGGRLWCRKRPKTTGTTLETHRKQHQFVQTKFAHNLKQETFWNGKATNQRCVGSCGEVCVEEKLFLDVVDEDGRFARVVVPC